MGLAYPGLSWSVLRGVPEFHETKYSDIGLGVVNMIGANGHHAVYLPQGIHAYLHKVGFPGSSLAVQPPCLCSAKYCAARNGVSRAEVGGVSLVGVWGYETETYLVIMLPQWPDWRANCRS